MLCPVFMRELKLDSYTRVFTGIITQSKPDLRTAVLDIELLGLSSAKNHEDTQIYSPSRKVVIVSRNVKVSIEGNPEGFKIPTPLGVILSSLPIGTKIAFTGKPYDPYIKQKKDPLSIEDRDRIVLDNQYLEVVGFNSTIAKNVLNHQVSQEKDQKSHAKWRKKLYGETIFKKLSDRFPIFTELSNKLSPFFGHWFVKGVAITVAGGIILFILNIIFGDLIKELINTYIFKNSSVAEFEESGAIARFKDGKR